MTPSREDHPVDCGCAECCEWRTLRTKAGMEARVSRHDEELLASAAAERDERTRMEGVREALERVERDLAYVVQHAGRVVPGHRDRLRSALRAVRAVRADLRSRR